MIPGVCCGWPEVGPRPVAGKRCPVFIRGPVIIRGVDRVPAGSSSDDATGPSGKSGVWKHMVLHAASLNGVAVNEASARWPVVFNQVCLIPDIEFHDTESRDN